MPRPWAIVLVAFLALAAVGAAWTAIDRRPPEWDHANHLERAVLCARDLGAGDVAALLERSSFYPPLVICAAGALYRLWPSDAWTAQTVMWLFLGVGMAATFLLGRRAGGEATGVVAAVVFGSAPFVVFVTMRFQLDLPLAALVALALWSLANTDGFTRGRWALLTGAICGLGMLTKPSFAVYVLPAVLVAFRQLPRAGVVLNVVVATAVATLVSLPWYGPRAFGMIAQVGARSGKQAAESGHPDPLSWTGLSFYPVWLVPQFGVLAAALLLVGVVVAVRRRQGMLLAGVLVPLLLFSLIQNKNLRYVLPLLPAAAVLAGLGFVALGPPVRRVATVLLAIGAVVQVSAAAFGLPPQRAVSDPPKAVDWKQRELLAVLAREVREAAPEVRAAAPATVSVVPNAPYFSVSNFRYYALRDGLDVRWTRAWDESPLGIDFMVLKTGEQGPSWTAAKPRRIAERLASDEHLARVFPVIAEVALPDGSTGMIRARRVPPLDASPGAIAEAIDAAIRKDVPRFARDVEGLDIALDTGGDFARGRVRRLAISARAASIGELGRRDAAVLRVRDFRIVADDVIVNPGSAVAAGRLDVLDASRLTIEQATITRDDLSAFLGALRQFRRASLTLEDGSALVRLGQGGPDVTARIRILPAPDRPFQIEAGDVRVGVVPLPDVLVNWVIRNYDPTPRLAARVPVPVGIGEVAIAPDAIRIRPTKEPARR
jgi:hypothetical protein